MYTMRPAEFTYHRPESLDEALALLDDETRPLAGGHSLLPMMKLRLSLPAALVDIGRIPGLDSIAEEGGVLRIGALARHVAVASSELVQDRCPALAEAAGGIGDPQVRNRGTIGGSVAHADPGADYPTILTALGATIDIASRQGNREVPAGEFFVGIFTTALGPGELVTSVNVPATPAGTGAAYVKHAHPASGYAVVGVGAWVAVEGGTCADARIVVGGATGVPVQATAVAGTLSGAAPSDEAIATAAERVADTLADPLGDTYASGEYRTHLAKVLTKRALGRAFQRAG